jgi:cytochrome P450
MVFLDLHQEPLGSAWRRDPCAVLFELAAHRPGEPVTLRIGSEEILVFQDAEAARHVARKRPENYAKNFGAFVEFFGASRLTADGERWATLQKLSQPSIVATDPGDVVESANRHFTVAIDRMLEAARQGSVLVDPYLDRAAASVVAEVTLGFDPDEISPTLIDDFRTILRYASLTTWNLPGTTHVDNPDLLASAISARRRLLDGVDNLLLRRREASAGQTDLLRTLMAASDDVDLFSEICTLTFAGSDTSAACLGWALWLLAESPELQERLRAEIHAAIGDGVPKLNLLPALRDVAAFESEVLRIFPPIPILSRVAIDDDMNGGLKVAAGQKVLLSIIGLHHDGRIYPQAQRTSLSRFPGGEIPRELVGHFLPFGLGRRACGGARVATLELTTALTQLIKRLAISNPSLHTPLEFDWVASLRPRGSHRLSLSGN